MSKTQRPTAPAAVVTGAGRGIGRGVVLALVREGFDVVGIDAVFEPGNRKAGLFEVKARVEELGGRFLPLAGDISRIDDHDRMLDAAWGVCGRIDVLVNNAGVSPLKRVDVLETSPESYDRDKYDRLIAGGLVPQGRWGRPEDVGRAVAALARGDLGYSTGAVIEVSGGMNIRRF